MVPNTFEGITLDTLPDKDRDYDYAVGYLTTTLLFPDHRSRGRQLS
jgi:hypothetical protein